MDDFIARVGTFFYLMATGLLVLFVASDASPARDTDYNLFFFSLILFILGYFFRRTAKPPPAAERFRSLRKWQEGQKKKNEEKAKEKK